MSSYKVSVSIVNSNHQWTGSPTIAQFGNRRDMRKGLKGAYAKCEKWLIDNGHQALICQGFMSIVEIAHRGKVSSYTYNFHPDIS